MLIPVEYRIVTPTGDIAGGWWAMPQVPSKGETVTLPGLHPATVRGVGWEVRDVPHGAMTMETAGLSGPDRLVARVYLDDSLSQSSVIGHDAVADFRRACWREFTRSGWLVLVAVWLVVLALAVFWE